MSNEIIGSNVIDPTIPMQRAIGDVKAMQLASITYCSLTNNIESTLKHYLPEFTLVWKPVTIINGTDAFIAYNGIQYVIAVRGSILNFSWGAFDNWFQQDFNIYYQTPWLYPANNSTKPMISQGAADGLDDLTKLKDKNGDTMLSFIMKYAIPNKKFIGIVGHSLGGNLATVYSMYLRYQILQSGNKLPAIYSVLTFAAPTSWNKAFADYFDASLTNTWRYYNVIDIVPYSACDIEGLSFLYPPPAPLAQNISATYKGITVTLSEVFIAIALEIALREDHYNSVYTTVNQHRGSIPLNDAKKIYKVTSTDPLIQWFEQASAQHDHNHYLDFLGGLEITCQ